MVNEVKQYSCASDQQVSRGEDPGPSYRKDRLPTGEVRVVSPSFSSENKTEE